MKIALFNENDIEAERCPNDNRSVKGTVGNTFSFFAKVSNRKAIFTLKRCKVDYLAIYKKNLNNGEVIPGKPFATYECYWGIRPASKNTKQLVDKIIFYLEWHLK